MKDLVNNSIYSDINFIKDEYSRIEERMAFNLFKQQEWNSYSEIEKIAKRKERLGWLENKIYTNSELPEFVHYESLVINFYEVIDTILSQIKNMVLFKIDTKTTTSHDEILMIRLYNILLYEKESINSTYDKTVAKGQKGLDSFFRVIF